MSEPAEQHERPPREMSARGMILVALCILVIAIVALVVLQHQIDSAATGINTAL